MVWKLRRKSQLKRSRLGIPKTANRVTVLSKVRSFASLSHLGNTFKKKRRL